MRTHRYFAVGIPAVGVVRRATTVALLVMGGTFAVTACGADGGGAHVLDSGGKHVLVGPPADAGEDAGISGRVTMIGDCLGIGTSVAIWPSGTTIASNDPLTIKVPELGEVKLGDDVNGAGGTHTPDEVPDGVTIPDTCESKSFVIWRPE